MYSILILKCFGSESIIISWLILLSSGDIGIDSKLPFLLFIEGDNDKDKRYKTLLISKTMLIMKN